jgi:hypothetical protein
MQPERNLGYPLATGQWMIRHRREFTYETRKSVSTNRASSRFWFWTAVTDRGTLCSLNYRRYANNAYVGSTPMEDACRTRDYESRKRICEHNYQKPEIVQACIDTYDATTEQIRSAKAKSPK